MIMNDIVRQNMEASKAIVTKEERDMLLDRRFQDVPVEKDMRNKTPNVSAANQTEALLAT